MRSIRRALAATAAGLAVAAGSIAVAGPAAAADPGCVGLPSVPAAYVCVVELNPTNALPVVGTPTIPVTVPAVCYYLSCTDPKVVNVPVPTISENGGYVAVIAYKGQVYYIGTGTGPVLTMVTDTVNLVVDTVNNTLNGLPSTDEVFQQVYDKVHVYYYNACRTLNRDIYKYVPNSNIELDCYYI
jgi:hypothetical protein